MINKCGSLLLFLMYLCFFSCDHESDALLIDVLDEEYQLYDYYIDEDGNEGIVSYVQKSTSISKYPKGYKYMIVLSLDESLEAWGAMGETVMKIDSLSDSELRKSTAGLMMLQCMYSRGIERYPAQKWCFMKNNSSEIFGSSWRLPTYYELLQIFGTSGKNVSILNQEIKNYGGTIIDNSHFYWTCIEDYKDYISVDNLELDYDQANRAILTSSQISTFSDKDRWLKKNHYFVRAIKYIYYYDY